jgi:hypothetical protein
LALSVAAPHERQLLPSPPPAPLPPLHFSLPIRWGVTRGTRRFHFSACFSSRRRARGAGSFSLRVYPFFPFPSRPSMIRVPPPPPASSS